MSDKRQKMNPLEVSSQTLQDELTAIKDRLSAIETIQGISNADVVKKYVDEHLKSERGKEIMRECAEPRSKPELIKSLNFNSRQALENHLNPLIADHLLNRHVEEDGSIVYVWSNLFQSLPRTKIAAILKAE